MSITIDEEKNTIYITPTFIKNLADKDFGKRSSSYDEVINYTHNLIKSNKFDNVNYLLVYFTNALVNHHAYPYKKGGLYAISGIYITIYDQDFPARAEYCSTIFNTILDLVKSNDSKVKFYALEALYNLLSNTSCVVLEENFFKIYDNVLTNIHDIDHDVFKCRDLIEQHLKSMMGTGQLDCTHLYRGIAYRMAQGYYDNHAMLHMNYLDNLESTIKGRLLMHIDSLMIVVFECLKSPDRDLIESTKCFMKNTFIPAIQTIHNSPYLSHVNLKAWVQVLVEIELANNNQYTMARQVFMALLENIDILSSAVLANLTKVVKFINKLIFFEHEFIIQFPTFITYFKTKFPDGIFYNLPNEKVYLIVEKYGCMNGDLPFCNIVTEIIKMYDNELPFVHYKVKDNIFNWIYKLLQFELNDKEFDNVLKKKSFQISFICEMFFEDKLETYEIFIKIVNFLTYAGKMNELTYNLFDCFLKNLDLIKNEFYFIRFFNHVQISTFLRTLHSYVIDHMKDIYRIRVYVILASILENYLISIDSLKYKLEIMENIKDREEVFTWLFTIMQYSPTSLITLCLVFGEYHMAYLLLIMRDQIPMHSIELKQIGRIAVLLDSTQMMQLRFDCFEGERNYWLIKFFKLMLLTLPYGKTFELLYKRLKSISIYLDEIGPKTELGQKRNNMIQDFKEWMDYYYNEDIYKELFIKS